MAGVSAVFFAYIGFDAVSTLAEESRTRNATCPQGMMWCLIICTVVYIVLALVLTGMVRYNLLNVSDPLAEVFAIRGVKWMLFLVSIAAVVAMTSVMLVFQLGQPRIWMSMSRDGLLPPRFASIHPKYKTPGFSTLVTGAVVGIPIFFTDETFILDFTSIGTLFAFVLVCGGVLMLPFREKTHGRFHLPYYNAKYIAPLLALGTLALLIALDPNHFHRLLGRTGVAPNIPLLVFYALCAGAGLLQLPQELVADPADGPGKLLLPADRDGGEQLAMVRRIWLLVGLACYFAYGWRHSNWHRSTDRRSARHPFGRSSHPDDVPLPRIPVGAHGAGHPRHHPPLPAPAVQADRFSERPLPEGGGAADAGPQEGAALADPAGPNGSTGLPGARLRPTLHPPQRCSCPVRATRGIDLRGRQLEHGRAERRWPLA